MLMLMDDSSSPDEPPVLYTKYCEGIDISETTPIDTGIMGYVARTGKPFIADDVREAGDLYDPQRHENYRGTGKPVRSVMCVRLLSIVHHCPYGLSRSRYSIHGGGLLA